MSRRSMLVGLAGLTGWVVAGCSGKPAASNPPPPPSSPSGSVSAAPTTPAAPTATPFTDTTPRWPLTGVPLKAGEEKKAAHAVVAVKVPVERVSFPQTGVDKADLVFIESQGKSYDITRLCAVFHSSFPAEGVNPVRSARPADLPLIAPLKGVIASTGATKWVVKYMLEHKKQVDFRQKFGDRTDRWKYPFRPGGWLEGGNADWKAVVAMPAALSRDAKLAAHAVPPVYLQYAQPGEDASTANGQPASRLTVIYDGGKIGIERHRWDWKSDAWKASVQFHKAPTTWYPWKVRSGKQISTPNLMVIFCKVKMGRIEGYSGHEEPIFSLIDGHDKFIYFHDGKYVTGTWKKGSIDERFEFTLDDGTPLKMAPGRTWIEMPDTAAKYEIK